MSEDERAIRDLVATWMEASKAGDTDKVLSLMTDDVIFMVPGQKPFGKAEFGAAARGMKGRMTLEGTSEIVELNISGDLAYIRNQIAITVTPEGGTPMRRAGPTLTILRKESDGRWRLARDANFVAEVK
jgi:uncharacterized protein (TIGR02246 family)